MGQINTNNYPTVDSLADADLLIVENAIHGTGTTTPKQLRENAIGTTPLQTTAQTVTGAINELKNEIDSEVNFTLSGAGAKTSVVSDVIDTNIVLHRAPKVGDRVLVYFDSKVFAPYYLKLYGVSSSDPYTLFLGIHTSDYYLNGLCLFEVIEYMDESLALDLIYHDEIGVYDAGTGISINNGTIANTMPQRGDDIKGYDITTDISSGFLGTFGLIEDYIIINFKANAVPDSNGKYHAILTNSSGDVLIMKYAVLKKLDGTFYSENIYTGMSLICKSNDGGTGTEADPIVLTVINVYHTNEPKIDANGNVTANGHVLDGQGNDLASVAALEASASGNPIVVNAQSVAAKELSVELEVEQNLHGYDYPWAAGAGKNILPFTVDQIKAVNTAGTWTDNTYEYNGVTYTLLVDSDNNIIGVKAVGTASPAYSDLDTPFFTIPSGDYILSGCPSGGSVATYHLRLGKGSSDTFVGVDAGSGYSFTSDGSQYRVRIGVQINQTVNEIYYPMMRISTASASYEPYSNYCYMIGRTSTSVKSNNENLLPNTYSSVTRAGITWTVNADGSIRATGSTGNTSSDFNISLNDFRGNFYFTGCPNGGTSSTYDVYAWDNVTSARPKQWNGTSPILSDFGHTLQQIQIVNNTDLVLRVNTNQSNVDLLFTPMLCLPTADSADFVPYKASNVGFNFGQVVYGAKLKIKDNAVNLTLIERSVDLGELNWTKTHGVSESIIRFDTQISNPYKPKISPSGSDKPNIRCSQYKTITPTEGYTNSSIVGITVARADNGVYVNDAAYSDATAFATAMDGVQLVYELATPIELELDYATLELLKGYNYITADGDMDIVYIPESVLPTAPTTDGTYKLICTVSNGVPTFSWAAN